MVWKYFLMRGIYGPGCPMIVVGKIIQPERWKEEQRNRPYYVEKFYNKNQDVIVLGFDILKNAKKHALEQTTGTYHMNGRLNDKEAKIFERGGKHIETYISGFPESEYNEIKERQTRERAERKDVKIKSVVSFAWNYSKKQ
jgi:hypothetical protein